LGPFTAAQPIIPAALGTEYHRRKTATNMRTVAKWLPTAASAAAPDIPFALSEFDFDRLFMGNFRIVHKTMLDHRTCLGQLPIGPNSYFFSPEALAANTKRNFCDLIS